MRRFVLLEHNWNGIHWDFMLEAGEALRTWAIDAPIVTGRDLPARALGDHRKLYLDYEGPSLGRPGAVRRVDAGTFRALDWQKDHVLVEVIGSQLVGEIDLRRSDGFPARTNRGFFGRGIWTEGLFAKGGSAD